MPAFPDVTLSAPYVGQSAYESDVIKILKVDDDVESKTLRAFVQLGDNPSFKYWVPVKSGEDYTVEWTNDHVTDAIKAFFV